MEPKSVWHFEFEGNVVRFVGDDAPNMCIVNDLGGVLGLKNPRKLGEMCDSMQKVKIVDMAGSQSRTVNAISYNDVFKYLIRSHKKRSKTYERKLFRFIRECMSWGREESTEIDVKTQNDTDICTVCELGCSQAHRLLQKVDPDKQRKLQPEKIDQMIRDLQQGQWRYAGDVIRVSESGCLLDGQHRCYAVVQSGIPIPSTVRIIYNIPDTNAHLIDDGSNRPARDKIRQAGYDERVHALVNLRLSWDHPEWTPTTQEKVSHADEHPEYKWAVDRMSTSIPGVTLACIKLAVAELYTRDHHVAEDFAEKLLTGACSDPEDPALMLRNYLLMNRKKNDGEKYQKAVAAMKAALKNENIKRLQKAHW